MNTVVMSINLDGKDAFRSVLSDYITIQIGVNLEKAKKQRIANK